MVRRLALIAVLALAVPRLEAATFVVRSDENLIATADAVVVGHVLGSTAQRGPHALETVTRIAVDRRLKSDAPPVVTLTEPAIPGAPRFEDGSRVLLFLMRTGPDRWATLDFIVGKFDFAFDSTGQEVVIREEEELTGFDVNGGPHQEPRRSATAFMNFIEQKARGLQASAAYHVERHPLIGRVRSLPATDTYADDTSSPRTGTNAINYPPSTYMMTCGSTGCRWSVFPTAVYWYNQNTLPGAPEGGIAAIRASHNAWNSDCASNINYQYAGSNPTAAGGLHAADGVNSVIFEATLAAWGAPPYACGAGGTIAIGGVSNASGSHAHLSETFVTTREGDVMVNQGIAACTSFSNSEQFLTAMTHEFGHTLGFRHSNQDKNNGACPASYDCSSSAVMNSSIIRGLNATLQQWDRNAAEAVYTGQSCTTPPPPVPTTRVRYDFNGDGKADIYWRNLSTGQNFLYLMSGNAIQSAAMINTEGNQNWQPRAIGDFNGDGKADIFWRHNTTGQNFIYLMNGNVIQQSGSTQGESNLDWRIAGVGDLNADGRDDVVWRNFRTGQNWVYFMNGLTATGAPINYEGNLNWTIAAVADFNVDGKADILWRNTATGQNWMYLMNGNVIAASLPVQGEGDMRWYIAGVADFNGDRAADILWRHSGTGQNWMYIMNANTVAYSVGVNSEGDPNWRVANTADFDGDGKADILWRNASTGENWMYLMNANVIRASVGVNREGNMNWHIVR